MCDREPTTSLDGIRSACSLIADKSNANRGPAGEEVLSCFWHGALAGDSPGPLAVWIRVSDVSYLPSPRLPPWPTHLYTHRIDGDFAKQTSSFGQKIPSAYVGWFGHLSRLAAEVLSTIGVVARCEVVAANGDQQAVHFGRDEVGTLLLAGGAMRWIEGLIEPSSGYEEYRGALERLWEAYSQQKLLEESGFQEPDSSDPEWEMQQRAEDHYNRIVQEVLGEVRWGGHAVGDVRLCPDGFLSFNSM